MSIEIRNFGAQQLDEMLTTGVTVVRGALDPRDLGRLVRHVPDPQSKAWRPHDPDNTQGWDRSPVRVSMVPGARLVNPAAVDLMKSVRASVQGQARARGYGPLTEWGRTGFVEEPSGRRAAQFMGFRYYRMQPSGEIPPHRDRATHVGTQWNFPVIGTRRYYFWDLREGQDSPSGAPRLIVAGPTDAIVQCERIEGPTFAGSYPASRPWHSAITDGSDGTGIVAIVNCVAFSPEVIAERSVRPLLAARDSLAGAGRDMWRSLADR